MAANPDDDRGLDAERPGVIAFASTNDTWGGSEDLWSGAAAALRRRGYGVAVLHRIRGPLPPGLVALERIGCRLYDIERDGLLPHKAKTAFMLYWPTARRLLLSRVGRALRPAPDLMVISQGVNFEGIFTAGICRARGIPYVLISQKAADMYWPQDANRPAMREMHERAVATLFVSEHNRRLTEEQLGGPLANARVVRNPFKVDWSLRRDWPVAHDGYRFACIARLDAREKGQDLLLRVLARPKWRERPLTVRFHGSGPNEQGMKDLAALLDLKSVDFAGYTADPAAVWDDCHGLILPSHCEGLPLSLVETMLGARLPIVTDVGGASEVLSDGVTGFLADAATERALDAAMERAWTRRAEWPAIAARAADHIRTLVPPDPAGVLADELLRIVRSRAAGG